MTTTLGSGVRNVSADPSASTVEHTLLADHVIVCGLRGIGLRIVEQLNRSGEVVVVIEEYADRAQLDLVSGWGITTIPSFGSSAATLAAAGIQRARAVVCVADSDLANLEIALMARETRPDVRVVSQLSNQAVGQAMADGNGPGAILDVSSLAAPAIVQACLSRRIHEVAVADEMFLIATLPVERPSTLRGLFGDLAPIAVVKASSDGSVHEVVNCPGRDFWVVPGDQVAMLGTSADFTSADVNLEQLAVTAQPARQSSVAKSIAVLVGIAKDFDPGLYRAVTALLVLVFASTLILWQDYRSPGMSPLDALYFTTETVTTVGYGDFNFQHESSGLRIWAILLMIGGITVTAVLMAFLTDMLISRRLNDAIGRRRARGLVGHVVVVGLGAFGIRVAAALVAAGKQVVVVERDSSNRFLAEAESMALPVIFGDATLPSTLDAARLSQSSAIAILTSNDMVNIETAIAVRAMFADRWADMGAVPVVTRVFDHRLGRTVSRRFGFENVHSTEEMTAPWFVGAALGLDVLGSFSVRQQTFMVASLAVEQGSSLAGLAMNELSTNTRVVGLTRAETGVMEHPPRRQTRFEAGDLAYLVGPYEELLGVLRRARGAA